MVLISINPTSKAIGWAFWHVADFRISLVSSGTMELPAGSECDQCRDISNRLRREMFGDRYIDIKHVLIERPSFENDCRNANGLLGSSMAIGAIIGCFKDAKPELICRNGSQPNKSRLMKKFQIARPSKAEARAIDMGNRFITENRASMC